MTRWISVLIVLPCIGCSGNDTASPSGRGANGGDTLSSQPTSEIAGGSTEDFTGDVDPCTTTSMFDLDETTPLGFSGAEVLANAAGRFEVPIRWVSLCQQSGLACSAYDYCDDDSPDRPMPALAGTETTVSIEIEARDELVQVLHRTPADGFCGEGMSVPVAVRVETADGALAEVSEGYLGDVHPDSRQATIGLRRPVAELQGNLGRDSTLPRGAIFRMVFGFYREKAWMEIDVETPGSEVALPVPLLSDMLPPFDTCALDIPRADIAR